MFQCDTKELPLLAVMGLAAHRTMNTARDMYREFDLNRSQAGILFTLYGQEPMSQKELAEKLNITAPSITVQIRKMEQAGYLTRAADQKDQRVMRLTLTEKGEDCIRYVKEVSERMDRLLFAGMNQEERLLFRRLLLQINENLENYEREEKA